MTLLSDLESDSPNVTTISDQYCAQDIFIDISKASTDPNVKSAKTEILVPLIPLPGKRI